MLVAIDYDETFTRDPEGWLAIISLLQGRGHSVVCVTLRPEIMAKAVRESIGKVVPCVFTHGELKRKAALEAGFKVDIWIDDQPGLIDSPTILL